LFPFPPDIFSIIIVFLISFGLGALIGWVVSMLKSRKEIKQ
jgi:hypothetical protein